MSPFKSFVSEFAELDPGLDAVISHEIIPHHAGPVVLDHEYRNALVYPYADLAPPVPVQVKTRLKTVWPVYLVAVSFVKFPY